LTAKKIYQQPSREGKRLIGAWIRKELAEEIEIILGRHKLTKQEFF